MSGSLATEDPIVTEILAGRTGGFRNLVDQYQQPVFRFARNLLGDDHEAEDISQEVFLVAFDRLASFDPQRASFLTWLFTITRNRCVNHLKRSRPVIDGEMVAHTQSTACNRDPETNEFWNRLDVGLDSLPIEQKTAFVLAEIEGLPYADIAQIEKTTLGTVKSRIHRAKQRLRSALAPIVNED